MRDKKRIHFIGIGGAGMSGLAEVFHCHGYDVQGSDIKKTIVTNRLEELGIRVIESHSAKNIGNADLVVYSSCITEQNVEVTEAKRKNIPVLRRIEALNMISRDKDIIAISGAHGKTTTTALVSYLLIKRGLDPSVFIGADVYFLNGNARYGKGNLVVTEADESDGSFLMLKPLYSVSTNIDKEHMDFYDNMDNVMKAYTEFIGNTREEGCVFACADDKNLREILKNSDKKIISYGISKNADVRAEKVELMGLEGARFDLVYKNKLLGKVTLSIMGIHNILNTLAAIGVAMELGIDFSFIQKTIRDFKGADRRFNVARLESDILVIDDYAHHPTEIEATLKTLEDSGKRIIAVFQPHRYSRTKYLKKQFGNCFDLADHLVITDIYSAHEKPIDGVSGEDLCENVKKCGHKNAHFILKDDIIGHLKEVARPKDAIFILGAGDIGELPETIAKALTLHFNNVKV